VRISPAKAFVAIFVVASAVRLTLAFGLGMREYGRPETIRIAISLARTGAFADPYKVPTGPTAHAAPFYPALIAPLYAIWGDTREAELARIALNAAAASAEYALLPLVAVALGLGIGPGILAGLGGALIPLHYWPECMGEFEATWVALFLEASTLLFARFLRAPSFALKRAFLAGLWWGGGFLISPGVAPVMAGFLALVIWRLRPPVRWIALVAAGIAAASAPWLVRNYAQLGGPVFVRDNLPLELAVSNHDGASPHFVDNAHSPSWNSIHPLGGEDVARELGRTGELAFERRKLHEALGWIRSHPAQFARLSLARSFAFWFPWVPRLRWAFWIVTLTGALGWALLWFRSKTAAAILGAVLIGHAAIFSIIETALRYQHPVWWALVLLTGFAVCRLAGMRKAEAVSSRSGAGSAGY